MLIRETAVCYRFSKCKRRAEISKQLIVEEDEGAAEAQIHTWEMNRDVEKAAGGEIETF